MEGCEVCGIGGNGTLMNFSLNGKLARVVFYYPHRHSKKRDTTICRIITGSRDDQTILAEGRSNCNLNAGDKFSKEEGRIGSLIRASKDLPREVRVKIWRAYWDRKVVV